MAKKTQSKILRVSDLPIINKVWDGMYTILAYNKQNYLLDVSKIKGKKIFEITSNESTESGGKNIIYIKFTDGTSESFVVYNGTKGDTGKTGLVGPDGNQGEDGFIDERKDGISGTLYIINNTDTQDPDSPWSAYRGKVMNDSIYELNETFITEAEYDVLFNNIRYMYAEFKTKTNDQSTRLFNNDTNNHLVYKKYWTYEDEGLETYYIYNPNSDTYDTVLADLWKDIYLGKKEGYFLATTSMAKDSTDLYYLDRQTNNYFKITKVVSVRTTTVDGQTTTEEIGYLGDKRIDSYYLPEIDASISADFSIQTNKWTLELNAKSELVPEVYVTEDCIHYTKLTDAQVLSIDTSIYAEYYEKVGDDYVIISNIAAYLATKEIRYYKRNVGVTDNLYSEVDLSDISEENFDDYLIVSRNRLTNVYTFERHHAELLYGEMVYYTDTVSLNNIDLYYYTSSRDYYTLSLEKEETVAEDGETIIETFKQVYTKIEIPYWIYAEFKTNDEDQLSLILNANEDLGEEDNTEIDNTEEDTNTFVREKNITRIVPGNKKPLYHKNTNNTYTLVNLNTDSIYSSAEYYILDDNYIYEEITGFDAKSNGISEVYDKNSNNRYILHSGILVDSETYYIRKENYIRVNNPEEYLSTYYLVLFYGEPQLLPISIYPVNSYRSYVTIEYDPEKIILYEDGRIAATVGNNFNSEIIIKATNNPSVYCTINVRLTTPTKQIVFDQDNINELNIGETGIIKYNVLPETSFDKEVVWSVSDPEALTIEQLDETSIRLTANKKSENCTITATAHDGFGATSSFDFEVIQPAESVSWDQDNVIYNEPVYYTPQEVASYMAEHYDEIQAGTIVPITTNDIKEPGYYSMVALLYKEYILSPKVEPEDTSYKDIIWTSSNPSIAQVIEKNVKIIDVEQVSHIATEQDVESGRATEVGQEVIDVQERSHNELKYVLTSTNIGNVEITGKLRRYNDLVVNISVRIDQSIETINVYPSTLSLNINTKKKLTAEILPDTAVNGTITWLSRNPNIVTVSPQGTITAINPGATTVIAHALDGSDVDGLCNVTVTIPAKDITLSGNTTNGIVYVGIGKTTVITAEITHNTIYGTNESNMNKEINWVSSDTDIATINESGTVTGIALGKTTIIANAKDGSGVFGTIQVNVIKLIEEISFDIDSIEMELSDSLVLVPNIKPIDASNEIVIWSSSDETVAKVKESGIVYAISSGEATITATTTDGSNLTVSCNITIL